MRFSDEMRKSGRGIRGRVGFTLVELLVVIAIIAILLSILLPAIRQSSDLAKSAICLSNLRSIGIALRSYSGDYQEYLPPAYSPLGVHMQMRHQNSAGNRPERLGLLYVTNTLKEDGGDPTQFSSWKTNAGYVSDLKAMYCPGRAYENGPHVTRRAGRMVESDFWWGWAPLPEGRTWQEFGYAGYSLCMPNTWNPRSQGRFFRIEDTEVQGWNEGLPYLARVACARGYVGGDERAHRQLAQVNVLYHSGAARSVPDSHQTGGSVPTCSDGSEFGGWDFWHYANTYTGQ